MKLIEYFFYMVKLLFDSTEDSAIKGALLLLYLFGVVSGLLIIDVVALLTKIVKKPGK